MNSHQRSHLPIVNCKPIPIHPDSICKFVFQSHFPQIYLLLHQLGTYQMENIVWWSSSRILPHSHSGHLCPLPCTGHVCGSLQWGSPNSTTQHVREDTTNLVKNNQYLRFNSTSITFIYKDWQPTSFSSFSDCDRKAIDLELVVWVITKASLPSRIAPVWENNVQCQKTSFR